MLEVGVEEIEMKEMEEMMATVYGKYIAGVTNTTANGRYATFIKSVGNPSRTIACTSLSNQRQRQIHLTHATSSRHPCAG